MLRVTKDLPAAEAACREAVRLDPKYVMAHVILGAVLHDRGDLASAEAACREALRLDPKHVTAHLNLGLSLIHI